MSKTKTFPTKYTITNIKYDTDGAKVKLPKRMTITIPDDVDKNYDDVETYISDEISNKTGFCHKGFATTPEIPEN